MIADVVIVGAGIAGIQAALALQEKAYAVCVIEKAPMVGGRLATQQVGEGRADTGLQFFTARTKSFHTIVDGWAAKGLVEVWGDQWTDGSLKMTAPDGEPRYFASQGMARLAESLAKDIKDLRLSTSVKALTFEDGKWTVHLSSGEKIVTDAIILTMPIPQALNLLEESHIALSAQDESILHHIYYGQSIVAAIEIKGETSLPDIGAIQRFDQPVFWVADNQRKGISSKRVITLQTSHAFSDKNWDQTDAELEQYFHEALQPYLEEGAEIETVAIVRWKYSMPLLTYFDDSYASSHFPNLLFAGDAFGGRGRFEGAALSGIAAAGQVKQIL
ncbi:FAD-dependent oxidoreductase [Anaerolineales bacterium]